CRQLLAELAGKEFASARQLAAYAGLSPAECRSGGTCYGQTHLSKIGNAFLRKALPSICRPQWPGAGVGVSSPGSLSLSSANSMPWPFAALSCASFSTSLSAFLVTNNPLTPRLFLFLKPFDTQDRIYKIISEFEALAGRLPGPQSALADPPRQIVG